MIHDLIIFAKSQSLCLETLWQEMVTPQRPLAPGVLTQAPCFGIQSHGFFPDSRPRNKVHKVPRSILLSGAVTKAWVPAKVQTSKQILSKSFNWDWVHIFPANAMAIKWFQTCSFTWIWSREEMIKTEIPCISHSPSHPEFSKEGLAQLKPGEPLRGTPPVTSVGSPLCGLPDGWEVPTLAFRCPRGFQGVVSEVLMIKVLYTDCIHLYTKSPGFWWNISIFDGGMLLKWAGPGVVEQDSERLGVQIHLVSGP